MKKCQYCQDGWFDKNISNFYFGIDVVCVNGVLIDIDEYCEGYQLNLSYTIAPCHPDWNKQQTQENFYSTDSQERLAR